MRRRAMHDRTEMMPVRRRRAPGVNNNRIHDWRLLGRLDARAVAMSVAAVRIVRMFLFMSHLTFSFTKS